MAVRFVTKRIHAFLDYPVAVVLMTAPFLLHLGGTHPLAKWLAVVTGAAAFALTMLTDHHLGVLRMLPYRLHLTVDFLVGLLFVAAPMVIGFSGLDAWFYWVNGAAILSVVSLHKPQQDSSLNQLRPESVAA